MARGPAPAERRGRRTLERPRRAALEATLDLMAEHGMAAVTTGAVAARARTSKATMYRHWRSKDALVADAIGTLVDQAVEVPDSGSLEGDLRALLSEAVAMYRAPRTAALVPELVAGMARVPALAEAVRTDFLAHRRAELDAVLRAAEARGELRADVDHDLCLDVLGGVLLYRLLLTGGPLDDRLVEELTVLLLRAIGEG